MDELLSYKALIIKYSKRINNHFQCESMQCIFTSMDTCNCVSSPVQRIIIIIMIIIIFIQITCNTKTKGLKWAK